jgi:hypothetical protein
MKASDLYGLPLDEFTKTRDELAKDLRKGGKKEAADEAKALRKPSVSAWMINQLARRHPQEMNDLTSLARHELDAGGQTLQRVAQTLRAGSIDKQASKALLAGTLATDVEQAGFGPLLSEVPLPASSRARSAKAKAAPAKQKPRKTPDRTRAQVVKLRQQLQEARKGAREERRRADAAAREAEKAQRSAEKAEAQVGELEAQLERLSAR